MDEIQTDPVPNFALKKLKNTVRPSYFFRAPWTLLSQVLFALCVLTRIFDVK